MKKVLAFFLTLSLMLSVFALPICAGETDAPGNNEASVVGYSADRITQVDLDEIPNILTYSDWDTNPPAYKITTPEGVMQLAYAVSLGDKFEGVTVYLANDINMESVTDFSSIGRLATGFYGIFDGQGHMIENLKADAPNSNDSAPVVALFGIMGGTVKNTILGPGCEFKYTGSKADNRVGTFVANFDKNGVIDNCYNMATVIGSRWAGGIASFGIGDGNCKILNCTNAGAISTRAKGQCLGGMIGGATSVNLTIENCRNIGSVTTVGEDINGAAGGMVGRCWSTGLVIEGCINNGAINGGDETNSSAGAMLGCAQLVVVSVYIRNCKNYGTLTALKTGICAKVVDATLTEENNENLSGQTDATLADATLTYTPDFTPNEKKEESTDDVGTPNVTEKAPTPTKAPTATNAPSTDAPATEAPTPAPKSGCGASVGAAMIVLAIGGASLMLFKKEEE